MKKLIISLLMTIPFLGFGQMYNPVVWDPAVSPAPMYNLADGGTGVVSFKVGNMGTNSMPLVTNQEMKIIISLLRGAPNATNPLDAVGGTYASFFNWYYDATTFSFMGVQNKAIPAYDGGTIEVQYKVSSNSAETSPQNGYNVNITPPPYAVGINPINDDQVSSYTWTIVRFITNPDVNVTNINVPVSGNVSTNDMVPTGTTYGTPVAQSGNPTSTIPTLNSNGSYTFTPTVAGVYNFSIPVCQSGQTTGCPTQLLTITVNPPSNIPPVANTDIASMPKDSTRKFDVKSNDRAMNTGGVLGNPTITTAPLHGTASVNLDGTIKYTPSAGYTGKDTLTYSICDVSVSPASCTQAKLIVTIVPPYELNTTSASDDYNSTTGTTPVSGNVSANDTDPQGNTQTVTALNILDARGTFTLSSSGAYTYTPASGVTGTQQFQYQTCDNGSPVACANATLYITVNAPAVLLTGNPDNGSSLTSGGTPVPNVTSNDLINGLPVVLGTNATISPSGSWPTGITLNTSTGAVTVAAGTAPGTYNLTYILCDKSSNCISVPVTITVTSDIKTSPDNGITNIVGGSPIANITTNDLINGQPVVLGTNATIAQIGTWPTGFTLNPTTGAVTVAPNTPIGTYTMNYNLCDNATPQTCKVETITITVNPLSKDTVIRQISLVSNADNYMSTKICVNLSELANLKGTPSYASCGLKENSGYTQVGPDANGCYTYIVDTNNIPTSKVYTCQVVCIDGICDTTIIILEAPIQKTVTPIIPNYITPNGDGVDDAFDLTNLMKEFPSSKLMIYNRWGNIVWRSGDVYKNDFNGNTMEGDPLPDGVYYFLIELDSNLKTTKTGFVEVMRN